MSNKKGFFYSFTLWEIFLGAVSLFVGFGATKFIVAILLIVIGVIFGTFDADVASKLGDILGVLGGVWAAKKHFEICRKKHLEVKIATDDKIARN